MEYNDLYYSFYFDEIQKIASGNFDNSPEGMEKVANIFRIVRQNYRHAARTDRVGRRVLRRLKPRKGVGGPEYYLRLQERLRKSKIPHLRSGAHQAEVNRRSIWRSGPGLDMRNMRESVLNPDYSGRGLATFTPTKPPPGYRF